jgi:FixJ family two-component response regulator
LLLDGELLFHLARLNKSGSRSRDAFKQRSEIAQLRNCYDLLTPREREVFALLILGLLNKQIAGELVTTERTIKFHRAHIMKKMRADSLTHLVRMAQKLGIRGQR